MRLDGEEPQQSGGSSGVGSGPVSSGTGATPSSSSTSSSITPNSSSQVSQTSSATSQQAAEGTSHSHATDSDGTPAVRPATTTTSTTATDWNQFNKTTDRMYTKPKVPIEFFYSTKRADSLTSSTECDTGSPHNQKHKGTNRTRHEEDRPLQDSLAGLTINQLFSEIGCGNTNSNNNSGDSTQPPDCGNNGGAGSGSGTDLSSSSGSGTITEEVPPLIISPHQPGHQLNMRRFGLTFLKDQSASREHDIRNPSKWHPQMDEEEEEADEDEEEDIGMDEQLRIDLTAGGYNYSDAQMEGKDDDEEEGGHQDRPRRDPNMDVDTDDVPEMGEEVVSTSAPPEFPRAKLDKLDDLVIKPRWVIPVLPNGELEVLINAAIALAKYNGSDESLPECDRFYREGLTISFQKVLTDEAVNGWQQDIHKYIFDNCERLVDLIVIKLHNWPGTDETTLNMALMDLLALLLRPDNRFHTVNRERNYSPLTKFYKAQKISEACEGDEHGPHSSTQTSAEPPPPPLSPPPPPVTYVTTPDSRYPRGWLQSLIDRFGRAHGFDYWADRFLKLLTTTQSDSSGPPQEIQETLRPLPPSINVVATLLRPFGLCHDYLHKLTLEKYFIPVLGQTLHYLNSIPEERLRSEAKTESKNDAYTSVILSVKNLATHLPDQEQLLKSVEIFRLKMVFRLLQINSFNLKMNALNEINKIIANVAYYTPRPSGQTVAAVGSHAGGGKSATISHLGHSGSISASSDPEDISWLSPAQLAQWIKENGVLQTVLRDSLHQPQYVEKLEKIVRFIIKEGQLSLEDLDHLWNAQVGKHEAIVKNVHDLLAKLAWDFTAEQLDGLFDRFKTSWTTANKKQREKLLELIRRLAEDDKDGLMANKVLNLLWNLAHSTDLPNEIMDQALAAHIKILDYSCSSEKDLQKDEWLVKCINELHADPSNPTSWVLPALKQIREICCLYSEAPPNYHPSQPAASQSVNQSGRSTVTYRSDIISRLQNTHSLVVLISSNLEAYMSHARHRQKEQPDYDPKEILSGTRFSHVQEVQERLNFLKFVLRDGQLWLCDAQARQIWHALAENAVYPEDRQAVFQWFSVLMSDEQDLDPDITREFFENQIMKLDPTLVTESGVECFNNFFKAVNVKEGKMTVRRTLYYMNDMELIGIDYLWRIILAGGLAGLSDSAAVDRAIELLKETYANIGPRLQASQHMIHEDFIALCMERMRANYDTIGILLSDLQQGDKSAERTVRVESRRISRVLNVLNEYIEQYEFSPESDLVNHPYHLGHGQIQTLPMSRSFYGKHLILVIHFPAQLGTSPRGLEDMNLHTHTNASIASVKHQILNRLKLTNMKVDLYCDSDVDPIDKKLVMQLPQVVATMSSASSSSHQTSPEVASSTEADRIVLNAKLVPAAINLANSPDSSSDSSGGSPAQHRRSFTGSGDHPAAAATMQSEQDPNKFPGMIIASKTAWIQFLFQIGDLGIRLADATLYQSAIELLQIIPPCTEYIINISSLCEEVAQAGSYGQVTSDQQLLNRFDVLFFASSSTQVIYSLGIIYTLLMPSGNPLSEQSLKLQLNFIRSGCGLKILELLIRNNFLSKADELTKVYASLVLLKIVKLLLVMLSHVRLAAVAAGEMDISSRQDNTDESRLRSALERIPNPQSDFMIIRVAHNVAEHLAATLTPGSRDPLTMTSLGQATLAFRPDLPVIRAVLHLAWAGSSGTEHAFIFTQDKLHPYIMSQVCKTLSTSITLQNQHSQNQNILKSIDSNRHIISHQQTQDSVDRRTKMDTSNLNEMNSDCITSTSLVPLLGSGIQEGQDHHLSSSIHCYNLSKAAIETLTVMLLVSPSSLESLVSDPNWKLFVCDAVLCCPDRQVRSTSASELSHILTRCPSAASNWSSPLVTTMTHMKELLQTTVPPCSVQCTQFFTLFCNLLSAAVNIDKCRQLPLIVDMLQSELNILKNARKYLIKNDEIEVRQLEGHLNITKHLVALLTPQQRAEIGIECPPTQPSAATTNLDPTADRDHPASQASKVSNLRRYSRESCEDSRGVSESVPSPPSTSEAPTNQTVAAPSSPSPPPLPPRGDNAIPPPVPPSSHAGMASNLQQRNREKTPSGDIDGQPMNILSSPPPGLVSILLNEYIYSSSRALAIINKVSSEIPAAHVKNHVATLLAGDRQNEPTTATGGGPERPKSIISPSCSPSHEALSLISMSEPLCDTPATLAAAYDLLCSLCEGCLPNLNLVLTSINEMFYNPPYEQALCEWEYSPPIGPRPPRGFVGLKNAGATCYMNSVLQQLYMIPEIRNGILSVSETATDLAEAFSSDATQSWLSSAAAGNGGTGGGSGSTTATGPKENSPTPEENISRHDYNCGVFKQIQVIFAHLALSKLQYHVPKGFWDHFRLFGEPVNLREQHDALEFFNSLVDSLDEGLKSYKRPPIMSRVLGGTFADQKICRDCPHRYSREESFTTLNIDIRNQSNLLDSLEQYVKGDLLEGANAYHCEKCDRKVDTVKRLCIKRLPELLTIQLKRFDYDWERETAIKFNDYFEFPRSLDMRPYTVAGLAEQDGEVIDHEEMTLGTDPTLNNNTPTEYELQGIVVHSGQASGGHYYSYIQHSAATDEATLSDIGSGGGDDKTSPPSRGDGGAQPPVVKRWYKFDDGEVTECKLEDDEEMRTQCFGGDYMGEIFDHMLKRMQCRRQKRWWNAYILVYRRRDTESRLLASDRKISLSSLTPLTTPTGLSTATTSSSSSSTSSLVRIPPAIQLAVQRQNVSYTHLKNQFCPEYFVFAKRLLASNGEFVRQLAVDEFASSAATLSWAEGMALDVTRRISQACLRFALNFLFYTCFHAKKTLRGLGVDWYQAVEPHLKNGNWMSYVKFLTRNPSRFSQYLLECPSTDVRVAFSRLVVSLMHTSLRTALFRDNRANATMADTTTTTAAANRAGENAAMHEERLIAVLDEKAPVAPAADLILSHVLNLIRREAAEHSRHLAQYFALFVNYATHGVYERAHLIRAGVPAVFMALALDDGPGPSIKYQYVDFTKLYQLISVLVRSCDVTSRCGSSLAIMIQQQRQQQASATSGGDPAASGEATAAAAVPLRPPTPPPPKSNPYAYDMEEMVLDHGTGKKSHRPVYIAHLSPQAAEALYKRPNFVRKMIEDAASSEDTVKLLQFACWENAQFSAMVLKELLAQITYMYAYELPPFMDLLLALLLLGDSWQAHRINLCLKGTEDTEGLLETIQRYKTHYSKRSYYCIKCLVGLFSTCSRAAQLLYGSADYRRRWAAAVGWLKCEMEKGLPQGGEDAHARTTSTTAAGGTTKATKWDRMGLEMWEQHQQQQNQSQDKNRGGDLADLTGRLKLSDDGNASLAATSSTQRTTTSSWSPTGISNEQSNGYYLERSNSARFTLERAYEIMLAANSSAQAAAPCMANTTPCTGSSATSHAATTAGSEPGPGPEPLTYAHAASSPTTHSPPPSKSSSSHPNHPPSQGPIPGQAQRQHSQPSSPSSTTAPVLSATTANTTTTAGSVPTAAEDDDDTMRVVE